MMKSNQIYEMKHKIYKAYILKNYLICIEIADCLVDKLNGENSNDKESYWYLNYYKTLANGKLGNIKEAHENALDSLNYMENYDITKYSLSLMMLAVLKKQLGDIEKAKSLFFSLSKCFKKLGYINLRIFCLFNLACIKKNFAIICRLINITYGVSYDLNDGIEMDKNTLLDEMEAEFEKLEI